jgi:Arc/MetJ-type ribon-helix-helix transcriptional regulator
MPKKQSRPGPKPGPLGKKVKIAVSLSSAVVDAMAEQKSQFQSVSSFVEAALRKALALRSGEE